MIEFLDIMKTISDTRNFKKKFIIGGNHDLSLVRNKYHKNDRYQHLKNEFLEAGCHYLEDEEIEVDGIRFYGVPWRESRGRAYKANALKFLRHNSSKNSKKFQLVSMY